jgi:hypothetical protein
MNATPLGFVIVYAASSGRALALHVELIGLVQDVGPAGTVIKRRIGGGRGWNVRESFGVVMAAIRAAQEDLATAAAGRLAEVLR